MEKTPFAGLTILEPGEGLDTDNGAFIDRDRLTIDHFLQLGAKLHRHNGEAGLINPTVPASGAVVASGGTIPSDLTISLGYTIEDAQGGETMISPLTVVSTGSQMDIPIAAPSAAVEYTGGSLLVNQYYYAVTWTDGDGGETPAGPAVAAERAPGFASGQVKLTNLTYGMAAAGAVEWRLFRAIGGGTYDLLATGGVGTDSFVDDGSTSVDCDTHPPTDSQNTTKKVNTLLVTLPNADANMARAANINLYGSLTGEFGEASSLGQYPIASAGAVVAFSALNFNDASPPDVNLSIGGASLIDPDTELLDWHWRRPVGASALLGSGTLGDVKLVTSTGQLYGVLAPSASAAVASEWVRLASGQAQTITASANGGQVSPTTKLTLIASGGARVTITDAGGGEARATIFAPALRASAASANPGVVNNVETLTFVGSAGASATVKDLGGGVAQVTLAAGAGGGGSVALFGSGSAAAGAETPAATKIELIGSAGVNIKESSPGGGVGKAVIEGQAAVLADGGMGVMLLASANASAARPKAFKQITWYCKVKPTNMAEFDIWIEEGP